MENKYHLFELPSFWEGDISAKTALEAKRYLLWFTQQIPLRIEELRRLVWTGSDAFKLDLSKESLATVGDFLRNSINCRDLSTDELRLDKEQLPSWFHAYSPQRVLDDLTISLCIDVGVYFGEVMRAYFPHLDWHIVKQQKRDADYHHPVLVPFNNNMHLNPIRIVVVYAYRSLNESNTNPDLLQLFEVWANLADRTVDNYDNSI